MKLVKEQLDKATVCLISGRSSITLLWTCSDSGFEAQRRIYPQCTHCRDTCSSALEMRTFYCWTRYKWTKSDKTNWTHIFLLCKKPNNISLCLLGCAGGEGDVVKERDDIIWLWARLPGSSPPSLLLWLLAVSCRVRTVPSSATNQRSWILAGAWRCRKSQHSRNWQRRQRARGTVRVSRWCKHEEFILQLLYIEGHRCHKYPKNPAPSCMKYFSSYSFSCTQVLSCHCSFFYSQRGCHSAVSRDGPDEYAWNTQSADTTQYVIVAVTVAETHARIH